MASPDQPLRPPELTIRSILTGLAIGAALTPCNVYAGLKIGWAFNMAIAAGLIGYGVWQLASRLGAMRDWGLLENNINQMIASSAASIISGGLVAPIPALTLLTGRTLAWQWLILWVFAVSALGVVVAIGLRQQLLLREKLAFPAGIATAETMTRIHDRSGEAASRLRVLLAAAGISGAIKLVNDLVVTLPRLGPPLKLGGSAGAPSFANLGFAFDPSLLLLGFGAIIGLRAGLSILVGTVIGWGFLAGFVLERGWAVAGGPDEAWFEPLVTWLLWPGATLMVASALTAFGLALAGLYRRRKPVAAATVSMRGQMIALAASTALVVAIAMLLFDIALWQALAAVGLSYVLAVVAARVTGEAGITPIGAMGQITQFAYGILSPGNLSTNLMTANITGGAAGQCADLMQDLKTGLMIGADLRFQIVAQILGVALGSLVGVAVYLLLVPDPAGMLMTEDWPAPAVATWKAVAEVMTAGLASLPQGALPAMAIAGALGILLALAERLMPRSARFLPSAPAVGLAFVIPAWNGLSLFLGAALAALLARLMPAWSQRHAFGLAAGLVAGESLIGVATLALKLLG